MLNMKTNLSSISLGSNELNDQAVLEIMKACVTGPFKVKDLKLQYNEVSDTAGEKICLMFEEL